MSTLFASMSTDVRFTLMKVGKLSEEFKCKFRFAEIIPNEYGASMKFCTNSGKVYYIPMRGDFLERYPVGGIVNLDNITFLLLHRFDEYSVHVVLDPYDFEKDHLIKLEEEVWDISTCKHILQLCRIA